MQTEQATAPKKIALVGAELEENLALRYIAASLELIGHHVEIVAFNDSTDIDRTVNHLSRFQPSIIGLSMIFTSRAGEFINLAKSIRMRGFRGHLIAGGPFAAFNAESLLTDYSEFDSIALGEGEFLMAELANANGALSGIKGLAYRDQDGKIVVNPSGGNPEELDLLPFPKREYFHEYFDKRIASILSSRGCWRNCAFCSINAWYEKSGGNKFRVRSIANLTEEISDLYFKHQVRIFNFQDDNFFLPNPQKAEERFIELRDSLKKRNIDISSIAIAVKSRPESITRETIAVLAELGLFRVFLGVENASENGLKNLNRRNKVEHILSALSILNDYDVHLAFNILMFEPDTTMADIAVNLRFIERHLDNPFNFCRAEVYPGTGLEKKLKKEGRLLGNMFGLDYRISDPRSELFHSIANHAFFDRNFNNNGLHYFNMQVDFYFQLLKRFCPELLTMSLRGAVRSFIKNTNIDTHQCLSVIYDFVSTVDPENTDECHRFSQWMRKEVDRRSESLRQQGECILDFQQETFRRKKIGSPSLLFRRLSALSTGPGAGNQDNRGVLDMLMPGFAIPYQEFRQHFSR